MKFVICTVLVSFSCIVAHAVAQPRLISDHVLQLLYSDIIHLESESFRVMVTLDALQEELDQGMNHDRTEQLFSELIRLYKYDLELSQLHKEYTDELQALISPENYLNRPVSPQHFRDTAIVPINVFNRIPEDAIPLPNVKPIRIQR